MMNIDSSITYGQPVIENLLYADHLQLRANIKIEKEKHHKRSFNDDVKLLFLELFFITRYVEWSDRPIRIVYMGAAPGFHLAKLMKLFRFERGMMIYFDLYDDQSLHPDLERYIEENSDQVTMYRELLTVENCERYIGTDENIYLITDSRDPKYIKDPIFGPNIDAKLAWQAKKEESYEQDMEYQKQICIKMRPICACLRFRPKHFYSGETDESASLEYFGGTVWLPIFADLKSTESRLVVSNYDNVGYKWSLKNYQYRLNYYNAEVRESLLLNPLTKEQTPLPNMLGNNYESVMVMVILIQYLKAIGTELKSVRLGGLMEMYTKYVMADYCSDVAGFFQTCSFNEDHSSGGGSEDQTCSNEDLD